MGLDENYHLKMSTVMHRFIPTLDGVKVFAYDPAATLGFPLAGVLMHFRSQKLRDAAQYYPCTICNEPPPSVAAHANKVALGKGTGIKVPDFYIAYVCQKHHDQIDGVRPVDIAYRTPFELWSWAHLKTVAIWFNDGLVGVTRR